MAKTIRKVMPGKLQLPKLIKVAAYARVSSGKDAMLHSLSAQVSYYTLIQRSINLAMKELFIRQWHKSIPPKAAHEKYGLYSGSWSTQMDRYWESNDGFTVSSRQIRTAWGTVEHVAISRMNGNSKDIPWAAKQQIKDELFGNRCIAIEVFPAQKNLIDTCDVYHLWVLPKDFTLPFGIHPTKDPQGQPIDRGYDFSVEDSIAWTESEERKLLMAQNDNPINELIALTASCGRSLDCTADPDPHR